MRHLRLVGELCLLLHGGRCHSRAAVLAVWRTHGTTLTLELARHWSAHLVGQLAELRARRRCVVSLAVATAATGLGHEIAVDGWVAHVAVCGLRGLATQVLSLRHRRWALWGHGNRSALLFDEQRQHDTSDTNKITERSEDVKEIGTRRYHEH